MPSDNVEKIGDAYKGIHESRLTPTNDNKEPKRLQSWKAKILKEKAETAKQNDTKQASLQRKISLKSLTTDKPLPKKKTKQSFSQLMQEKMDPKEISQSIAKDRVATKIEIETPNPWERYFIQRNR